MNDRINNLAMQLAEELEKYEREHGEPQVPEQEECSEAKLDATTIVARMKLRLNVAAIVLDSNFEFEHADELTEVMQATYDFVLADVV